jgi:putative transcriptional regulator
MKSNLRHAAAIIFLGTLLIAARMPAPAPKPPSYGPGFIGIKAGKFLVASRKIIEPLFRHTVILIIEHNEQGTMGLIVNRPVGLKLDRLFPDLEGSQAPVYSGGPVQPQSIWLLMRAAKAPDEDVLRVMNGLYISGNPRTIERLKKSPPADASGIHAFAGYAGWSAGQLENEILRGDWYLMDGDTAKVFSPAPETLWDELMEKAGMRI